LHPHAVGKESTFQDGAKAESRMLWRRMAYGTPRTPVVRAKQVPRSPQPCHVETCDYLIVRYIAKRSQEKSRSRRRFMLYLPQMEPESDLATIAATMKRVWFQPFPITSFYYTGPSNKYARFEKEVLRVGSLPRRKTPRKSFCDQSRYMFRRYNPQVTSDVTSQHL
jgi:hypothetical protein